jgi:hypothetical protein
LHKGSFSGAVRGRKPSFFGLVLAHEPTLFRFAVVASMKAALFWVRKEHLVWRRAPCQLGAGKGGSTVMTAFLAGVKNPSSSMVPVGVADE